MGVRKITAQTAAANAARGPADEYLQNFAATTIQRFWKGHRVRKAIHEQQTAVAQYESDLRDIEEAYYRADAAARTIQGAWQSFRNRRIYQYYRDLIQFRERGDPKEILRSINPREAQLMDAAAGMHIRFRLGGTTFPPLVFYKIFTHRPVTDICAFCPRDYAQEVRMTATDVHNKPKGGATGGGASSGGAAPPPKKKFSEDFDLEESLREYIKPDGSLGLRSTRGWYERFENNGWRPISERLLMDEDPVTTMTKLKRTPFFHFNPAVRRDERVRRAKQRKREWMLKMYRDGMTGGVLPGGGAAGGAGGLGPEAFAALQGRLDELDLEELDPLAEELLQWTDQLDFEGYLDDWTSLACTLGSEALVPEPEQPYLSPAPPPSHDLRGAMATAGVPLAPFKGGATPAAGATSTLNI